MTMSHCAQVKPSWKLELIQEFFPITEEDETKKKLSEDEYFNILLACFCCNYSPFSFPSMLIIPVEIWPHYNKHTNVQQMKPALSCHTKKESESPHKFQRCSPTKLHCYYCRPNPIECSFNPNPILSLNPMNHVLHSSCSTSSLHACCFKLPAKTSESSCGLNQFGIPEAWKDNNRCKKSIPINRTHVQKLCTESLPHGKFTILGLWI